MKRTPANIIYHELIGLKARIISYPDPNLKGVEGVIVGETRRTILLKTGDKRIRLVKMHLLLEVEIPGYGWTRVKGELLTGTPQDRAKRILRGR